MTKPTLDFNSGNKRIAVIGGGISGIVAAHLIARKNQVVLYEKEKRLGGHTFTKKVDNTDKAPIPVDMGFIVFNGPNYPTFNRFITQLKVERAKSDMSFAFHDPQTGFMYAGTGLRGMFARWQNVISPSFWRMVWGMRRFSVEARQDLHDGKLTGTTIGEYLDSRGYSEDFEEKYLLPMAGAIWSAPEGQSRDFPAEALVRFFDNHMLLDFTSRPQWYYIKGGSQTYVRAFEKQFQGEIRTNAPVISISREKTHVDITTDVGTEPFDAVVLATHGDISLKLLDAPSKTEKRLLSPWVYPPNRVVLHTDKEFMPPKRSAWGSWVFIKDPHRPADAPVGVSYHMNKLQNIKTNKEFIVTLNPVREPQQGTLIEDINFSHPQYSLESLATQKELHKLNGVNRTFFCGAYQGYGFHEDGAKSGAQVGKYFGESL
jgi:predicted NAD/FAD-binding protein